MKTKMGKTARDLAMLQKHTEVVEMLDSHLKRGRTRPQVRACVQCVCVCVCA
jgi:hypothetical protein